MEVSIWSGVKLNFRDGTKQFLLQVLKNSHSNFCGKLKSAGLFPWSVTPDLPIWSAN